MKKGLAVYYQPFFFCVSDLWVRNVIRFQRTFIFDKPLDYSLALYLRIHFAELITGITIRNSEQNAHRAIFLGVWLVLANNYHIEFTVRLVFSGQN